MGVSKTGNLWIINTLGCTCHVVLRLVAALYAMSYGCMPYRSALHLVEFVNWRYTLSFGPCGCRLARWVIVWLLSCRLARICWFSLSCGHSHCCLGHCCGRWVERWSVGLRNEGKKCTAWASRFLSPPLDLPSPPLTGPHPS